MKTSERIFITVIVCLTILVAVYLHGVLNRFEVYTYPDQMGKAIRYDHTTGKMWFIDGRSFGELGIEDKFAK